jgi:subtilisin family serine protease
MSAVTVVIRTAIVAAFAVPGSALIGSFAASDAQAQIYGGFGPHGQFAQDFNFGGRYLSQSNGGGGRGGGRGNGGGKGGRFHTDRCETAMYDFCKPNRGSIPRVVPYYAPEVYYVPEYDPNDLPSRQGGKPPKKPVKTVAPKKPGGANGAAAAQTVRRDFVPNEVIVEVPLSTPEADVDALATAQRIQKLGSTEIALLNTRIYRWRITDGRPVDAVVAAISADARVSGAHVNHLYQLQQTATAGVPPQYAADKMKLNEAHALTRGDNVLVALIDSGADVKHPELAGVVVKSFNAAGGEDIPHAHGTGMAGAIAGHAMLQGVAPGAKILNVRAFSAAGKTEDGTTFDVIRGMDWAAQNGAKIFNLSFAGPQDPLMSRVIKAALARKIIVVAAAGNAGPKSPPLFPGAEPGVIAVSSTNADDAIMPQSNRGKYVSVAAPGVDILVAAPKKAYAVSSGTSISAAYVSGMVALIVARNPTADAKEVAAVLMGTAKDLGPKGRDVDFGAGLANPVAALDAMEPVPQVAKNAPAPATVAPASPAQAAAPSATRAGFTPATTPQPAR